MKRFIFTIGVFAATCSMYNAIATETQTSYVTVATAPDTVIGRARFTGEQPPQCTNYGGMQIFHNGSLRKSYISDGVTYWEASGNVWVLYNRAEQVGKHKFTVKNGSLQEQSAF